MQIQNIIIKYMLNPYLPCDQQNIDDLPLEDEDQEPPEYNEDE